MRRGQLLPFALVALAGCGGGESKPTEEPDVRRAVQGWLSALEDRNFKSACSHLSADTRAYIRSLGRARLGRPDCPRLIGKRAPWDIELPQLRDLDPLPIEVRGERATLRLPDDRALHLRREDRQWRLAMLDGEGERERAAISVACSQAEAARLKLPLAPLDEQRVVGWIARERAIADRLVTRLSKLEAPPGDAGLLASAIKALRRDVRFRDSVLRDLRRGKSLADAGNRKYLFWPQPPSRFVHAMSRLGATCAASAARDPQAGDLRHEGGQACSTMSFRLSELPTTPDRASYVRNVNAAARIYRSTARRLSRFSGVPKELVDEWNDVKATLREHSANVTRLLDATSEPQADAIERELTLLDFRLADAYHRVGIDNCGRT